MLSFNEAVLPFHHHDGNSPRLGSGNRGQSEFQQQCMPGLEVSDTQLDG